MYDHMTLSIQSLSHDGRGIAKIAQKNDPSLVCFVQNALPGQRVHVRITQKHKRYWEAECLGIEDRGDTIDPPCPHQSACGGCPLQCLPYERQLLAKGAILRESLLRIGHLSSKVLDECLLPPIPSPSLFQYRNKMEFAFSLEKGELILGQHAPKSRLCIETPHCLLLPKEGHEILRYFLEYARKTDLPPYFAPGEREKGKKKNGFWRFVILRHGYFGTNSNPQWLLLCLTSHADKKVQFQVRDIGETLLNECPNLAQFIHEERHSADQYAFGEKRILSLHKDKNDSFSLPLGSLSFALDPASFFQVNLQAAEYIGQFVTKHLLPQKSDAPETLLDLFCGVGAPALLGASRFSQIHGVELQKKSVDFARINAQACGIPNARYHAGRVEEILPMLPDPHCIIADPPRSGLGERIVKHEKLRHARTFLYISCNPATLARDLSHLLSFYTLREIQPIDLFPHTPHIETCVLLEKK